jgi:magnesium chelatase family protein
MTLGRAFSVAVRGLEGEIVEIEADITSGLPGVHLVGLPDTALQESRDRVRAAITNCGNSWPMARLTLALSPATLPKMGSVYDLALAAAVLSAHGKTGGNGWKDTAAGRWRSTAGASGQGCVTCGADRQTRGLAGRGDSGRQPP